MKIKHLLFFIPVTFLVACEGTDLIEPDNVSKEQISTQIIYNPTKYSKQKLTNMLFVNYKKYGRRLTQTEIKEDKNLPNPSIIFNYFQTTEITKVWNEVLEKTKL